MGNTATRTEYEQLEYQRKNPHLYTTMTQSVNSDGTITTYEQVTRKLQEAVDKLQSLHNKTFGGKHPVYCMRPVIGAPDNTLCKMIEMHKHDMEKCLSGFVRNYKYMVDRTTNPTKE